MFDTQKTNNRFIVVYDKLTEPIAQSIANRAIVKGIESTTWSKKEYLAQKPRLTNNNYVLLLDESIMQINLADPTLEIREIIPGVQYKLQGHQLGLFVDKESDDFKTLCKDKNLGKTLLQFLGSAIAAGLIGVAICAFIKDLNNKKKAKFYLLMKAIDEFEKEDMLKYVSGKL